ncbi:Chromosomal serine/threonine-protein kinase JIL-1 [Zootermopsis nevadensis]|uniref:Chromosomal serine/threonine-protein kinase JIL-1 n=1 Tax=Zootermopsis nevadensis TaxID=136037 RepID=A0A067QUA9_ZOONE|nr:Chromosomal serine/threonine-protein kinase JIL-1 [Zootermopsis nevadensis]
MRFLIIEARDFKHTNYGCVFNMKFSDYKYKNGVPFSHCRRILEQDPEIPKKFSAKAKHFVVGLLTKEPKKRFGAGENGVDDIKSHPFFNVSSVSVSVLNVSQ